MRFLSPRALSLTTSVLAAVVALAAFAAPAAAQLELAPAPREIDGLTATPMDITRMEGSIVFDIDKQEARAVADMWFTTGAAGTPVFDLRQPISSAMLDGKEIDPAKMKTHDFGKATGTMRILEVEMEAGTEHHLHLEYTLQKPASPRSQEIGWLDGGVHWDTFFSDLNQGRYMEMWFPANLLHDQHPVTMNLKLVGASKEHQIVTNGTVEELGEMDWKLSFPASYSAFSHMVVILPSELVERSQSEAQVDGRTIHIDATRLKTARPSLEDIHAATAQALQDFSSTMGPWAHGNRCTVFVWTGGRSMEYDGATTTSMGALRHELFHSWFGRGAKPSDQNAGWWDEAWNVYFCDGFRPEGAPVRKKDAPVTLATPDPWNRTTPGASYRKGAFFFGRLADVMGQDELIAAMSAFFKAYSPNPVSTEQMVDHLAAAAGKKGDEIRALFNRYVYGKDV